MKHFLDIHTTDPVDLRQMIDDARAMKTARNDRPKGMADDQQPLAGRTVALIFENPPTRTRERRRGPVWPPSRVDPALPHPSSRDPGSPDRKPWPRRCAACSGEAL